MMYVCGRKIVCILWSFLVATVVAASPCLIHVRGKLAYERKRGPQT